MAEKTISVGGLDNWNNELCSAYQFTYNESKTKVINARCKVCFNEIEFLKKMFPGRDRLTLDAMNYAENGTRNTLKPNFEKHIKHKFHLAAYGKKIAKPVDIHQNTLKNVSGLESAIKQCELLMRTAFHVGLNEHPFAQFPRVLDLQIANGLNIGLAYSDDKSCIAFMHLLAMK